MQHVKFIALIVTAAGLAAGYAAEAQPRQAPRVTFEQVDTDGSGEITRAEILALRASRFARADLNGDGKLTAAEMQANGGAHAARRAQKMTERFDANGDGALSLAELPEAGRRGELFSRIDADGSGTISKQEFSALRDMARRRGQDAEMEQN